MLTSISAALALGLSLGPKPIYCPVTLKPVASPAIRVAYAGNIFGLCCASCETSFEKNPAALIAKAAKSNKTVAIFEFDPVSGIRIDPATAPASTDFQAVRYYFADKAEKRTFDSAPGKFVGPVTSESFHCPVMDTDTTLAEAQSYADYKGVRYFMCCSICVKKFRADPDKYSKTSAASVKPLAVTRIAKS